MASVALVAAEAGEDAVAARACSAPARTPPPPPRLARGRGRGRRRIMRLFAPYRMRLSGVLALIVFSSGLSMISPFLLRAARGAALCRSGGEPPPPHQHHFRVAKRQAGGSLCLRGQLQHGGGGHLL